MQMRLTMNNLLRRKTLNTLCFIAEALFLPFLLLFLLSHLPASFERVFCTDVFLDQKYSAAGFWISVATPPFLVVSVLSHEDAWPEIVTKFLLNQILISLART